MTAPRSLELSIESDFALVAWVGVSVRAVANELGFNSEDADAIELAVVEVVNNTIEHAYAQQPGRPIRIRLSGHPGALEIEVWHRGAALSPAVLEEHRSAGDDLASEGGRGLSLVLALMDSVELRTRGPEQAIVLSRRISAAATAATRSE
jgi:anti-sigma regulatory factor (Ser/Thr protein kinase)